MSTRLRRSAGASCVLAALLLSPSANAGPAGVAALPQSSNPAAARKDYALIYGTIWGPGDLPVAGVPVTIRRASDKKPKWELVSDRRGEFAQRVPVGAQDYVVQANVKVPKGQPKPEVTVHIDDDERKDISIRLNQ